MKHETLASHPVYTRGQWTTVSQIPGARAKLEEGADLRRDAKEAAASEKARQKAETKAAAAELKQERLRALEAERQAQEAEGQSHAEAIRRRASNASQNTDTDSPTAQDEPATHNVTTQATQQQQTVGWLVIAVSVGMFVICFGTMNNDSEESATDFYEDDGGGGVYSGDSYGDGAQRAWYSGGDLHTKRIADWRTATYANRLATCADFVMALKKYDYIPADLRSRAQELESCISESVRGGIADDLSVSEVAAT
ncbi:MAG TPA: hypothetical protein VMM76_18505, partial [Pirellulaceae bacterium]|nr:hypothetical protein [Pirellulaceae bacterium]